MVLFATMALQVEIKRTSFAYVCPFKGHNYLHASNKLTAQTKDTVDDVVVVVEVRLIFLSF